MLGSSAAQSNRDDVWDLFILSQHKKQLTYLGKQDYKQLSQELHQSNCNFRYRVLDMDGNVLMDNLGGTAIGDQVDQVYDTIYSVTNCSYVEFSESGEYHDATETATITAASPTTRTISAPSPRVTPLLTAKTPMNTCWSGASPLP